MWIVQEIILAQQLTFFCGTYGFDWARHGTEGSVDCILDCFGAFVDDRQASYDENGILQVPLSIVRLPWEKEWRELAHGQVSTLILWRKSQMRPTLVNAITEFGFSKCKFPRNRVYGLLGLATNSLPADLVDTGKDLLTIFYDTILHCRGELNSTSMFKFAKQLFAKLNLNPSIVLEGHTAGIVNYTTQDLIPYTAYSSDVSFPAELELETMTSAPGPCQGLKTNLRFRTFGLRPSNDLSSVSIIEIMRYRPLKTVTAFTADDIDTEDVLYRIRGTRCSRTHDKERPILRVGMS